MPRRTTLKKPNLSQSSLLWSPDAELIGLVFELIVKQDSLVSPLYTTGLHAWFLDQVRSFDPELSAYLHDGESEKSFTISTLYGELTNSGRQIKLSASTTYYWYVTALSNRVQAWMV